MSENKGGNDVVGLLREKTEEVDLKQFLKSTFGGYTKKSVIRYLAVLKKQQLDGTETFNSNLKALFEEKENLKAKNQLLSEKLLKAENNYKNLYDSMLVPDLEKQSFSEQDVSELKKSILAKENEISRLNDIIIVRDKEAENFKTTENLLNQEFERSRLAEQTQKDLLAQEKCESKKLRGQIAELTNLLDDARSEISYLKTAVSEANVSALQGNIAALTAQTAAQAEIIANLYAQNNSQSETIEKLTEENRAAQQDLQGLAAMIDSLSSRNEKITSANQALKEMLQAEYKKKIELITEKTDMLVEKLAVQKKLDDSHTDCSLLELQLDQMKKQQARENEV